MKIDTQQLSLEVEEVDLYQPCRFGSKTGVDMCYQCPGFYPHEWRNSECEHCGHNRFDHDVYLNGFVDVQKRISSAVTETDNPTISETPVGKQRSSAERLGLSWVPQGLSDEKVSAYMNQLPKERVPTFNTEGERYRDVEIMRQLPKQDFNVSLCSHLRDADDEKKEFLDFCRQRDQFNMSIAEVRDALCDSLCFGCDQPVKTGQLIVFAKLANDKSCWHPACFKCNNCGQLLVDLVYCHRQGKLYCERHFAELIKPRCAACQELIFSAEYTKASDGDWHMEHFNCSGCKTPLVGHRYIMHEDKDKKQHEYCIGCYEKNFAFSCEKCGQKIGVDSKDLSYEHKHWHEGCFVCAQCGKSLANEPFATKDKQIFDENCFSEKYGPRCKVCGNVIASGSKKFEYKDSAWHEQCFQCAKCKKLISVNPFIPLDDQTWCVDCYNAEHGKKCAKCKEVITDNKEGVSYKNEPFHRNCFVCTEKDCGTKLAGEKFTSVDQRPVCVQCYAKTYARQCNRCKKPIMEFGTCKFIGFEGKNWHSSCFTCCDGKTCNGVSLVGHGFLVRGDDVVCPKCG